MEEEEEGGSTVQQMKEPHRIVAWIFATPIGVLIFIFSPNLFGLSADLDVNLHGFFVAYTPGVVKFILRLLAALFGGAFAVALVEQVGEKAGEFLGGFLKLWRRF